MKKLVFLSLMLACFVTAASAQTNSRYYALSAKDNYFMGVGVGAQALINHDNNDYGYKHAITPLFNLSVGKLITPVWGVRLQFAGVSTRLYSHFVNGHVGPYNEYNKKYITARFDGMFNFSNAFAGYNPDRVVDVYGFMGPALQFVKNHVGLDEKLEALINGSIGLGLGFQASQSLAINLEARAEMGESPFAGYSCRAVDGAIGVNAGITYYFGGKKFVKVVDEALCLAANGDIQKYKELLAAEQADHNATKEALAKEKAKPAQTIEKVVEIPYAGPRAIFFTIGSAKIDAKGNVNIELAAQIMKENTDVKYEVVGYADKATGSAKTNATLSEKRAKAVYEALVKAGVSENQISYRGIGGHEDLWDSRTLTRVVVIEPVK